jgi:hypothetical protein
MKKVILFMLALAIVLACLSLIACGGEEGEDTSPPPSKVEETAPSEEAPAPSAPSGGLSWNDMPVYSGAKQVTKGSWSIPPTEGDYSKVEWRYYETGDSLDDVASFYKSKMPGNGWEEMGWMEVPQMKWGVYNKDNENEAATVWVGSDNGETAIALMRASK